MKIQDSMQSELVSSIEIIDKTGISRATLNNYIKKGLIPRPMVKKTKERTTRARMLGYFPATVLDVIVQIKTLKKQGYSMEDIINRLKPEDSIIHAREASTNEEVARLHQSVTEELFESSKTESADMQHERRKRLNLTIDEIKHPAYLLNNEFQIDWINTSAETDIFDCRISAIKDPLSRNIFFLLMSKTHQGNKGMKNLLDFHLGFVKGNADKTEKLLTATSRETIAGLVDRFNGIAQRTRKAVDMSPLLLYNQHQSPVSGYVHYMLFREGTLFIHTPVDETSENMAGLFSKRTKIITDLLKQRMPQLISFCVLVADLQNSVRICTELPPDEYFELINEVWGCVELSFNHYYGTHGKHAGDGMLYYFLKGRDNQYLVNALSCALEIREKIKKLNHKWKGRKGWLNELYLNIGITEGEEYFGTIPSAPGIEFTVLGDTVNHAARLSDFARHGAIWTTKNLINKLGQHEKENFRYGVRHVDKGREVLVEKSFVRIMDMLQQDTIRMSKVMDIATLPITEILSYHHTSP